MALSEKEFDGPGKQERGADWTGVPTVKVGDSDPWWRMTVTPNQG